MTDAKWMRKALALARKGWGTASPNPMVGAIVVRNGAEIGRGWHANAGDAHAEIVALNSAKNKTKDATLYITLEPCSTHGRTPPCVDTIISTGIKRVVIASRDPNPAHNGKGIETLQDHGLEVVVGVEEKRSQLLNVAFACWVRYDRPFVLLKMAMTVDGKIATENGDSQWISGPISRKRVQKLRQWADAILVGAETVRLDNPQLLVRSPKNWSRQPLRIIASRSGNLGKAPQVLSDGKAETRIVACQNADEWRNFLSELGRQGITSLLVEGGGELAGSLLQDDLIDKIAFFIAPKLLGGRNSRGVIGGPNPQNLLASKELTDTAIVRSGTDFLLTGYLSDVHRMY